MFVQSNRPPSPTSITATSIFSSAKYRNAIAVVNSKKEGWRGSKKSRSFSTKCTTYSCGYGNAVYTDAFAEIHQMGRGVKAHAVSRLLQYGSQCMGAGAFAIGPCNVDCAERTVGMSRNVRLICACFPNLLCMRVPPTCWNMGTLLYR